MKKRERGREGEEGRERERERERRKERERGRVGEEERERGSEKERGRDETQTFTCTHRYKMIFYDIMIYTSLHVDLTNQLLHSKHM